MVVLQERLIIHANMYCIVYERLLGMFDCLLDYFYKGLEKTGLRMRIEGTRGFTR